MSIASEILSGFGSDFDASYYDVQLNLVETPTRFGPLFGGWLPTIYEYPFEEALSDDDCEYTDEGISLKEQASHSVD
jgi:hypothetical protein